ncbi:stalk domain-containing protein [Pseudoflavonifractor phocaeensis]|uniref:stalk domain-containing protein n=1 Tax=Pseudoflavonifractor phocaeensis TaxID=1870988 RepID=UPI0021094D10|nr:stalk domain-containing protein [Pseudoflavonifractor phocaeensis]MCQ4863550.1 copper amine oxidase N-terminal domain-containing protein [Pseudoflavonifractor phocaeensis]
MKFRGKEALLLAAGIVAGAVAVGPAAQAAVEALTATPSTQTFYVDGKQVALEAYVIQGRNYVQLRDVGRAVGFGVTYDGATNAVYVDTSSPYAEEGQTPSTPAGALTVPQSDAPFRPLAGEVVLLDDGSTFTVTEAKPEEPALPEPVCDWSQFPELELPAVQAKRGQTGVIMILNLHEIHRMQYTFYNCVPNCPELWEDGALKLSSKGNPILRLQLGITEAGGVQPFWPWRDEQLTQVFYSAPMAQFAVSAWDYYNSDGQFMYTRYSVQAR